MQGNLYRKSYIHKGMHALALERKATYQDNVFFELLGSPGTDPSARIAANAVEEA